MLSTWPTASCSEIMRTWPYNETLSFSTSSWTSNDIELKLSAALIHQLLSFYWFYYFEALRWVECIICILGTTGNYATAHSQTFLRGRIFKPTCTWQTSVWPKVASPLRYSGLWIWWWFSCLQQPLLSVVILIYWIVFFDCKRHEYKIKQ